MDCPRTSAHLSAGLDGGRPVTLHAYRWGTGRPAAVFLHPLLPAASGLYALEIAQVLCRRYGVSVVAPDMPGFGRSAALSADAYGMRALAQRLVGTLREAAIDRAALVGHSWGAALACHLAAAAPDVVDALVLLDGGHFDHADLPEMDASQSVAEIARDAERDGWRIDAVDRSTLVEEQKRVRPRWTREMEEVLMAGVTEDGGRIRSICTDEVAAKVMKAMLSTRTSDSYHVLRDRGIPVLLLTATLPPERAELNRARVARFVEAVPDADVIAVDGAGHDLVLDAAPVVADRVGSWLVRVDPRYPAPGDPSSSINPR